MDYHLPEKKEGRSQSTRISSSGTLSTSRRGGLRVKQQVVVFTIGGGQLLIDQTDAGGSHRQRRVDPRGSTAWRRGEFR